ncbi:hypothetical protein [Geodermatophilus maliterrae]|uniref:Uncharacterized protein n=1 Tax=Geodermatophilus maliterrae TaxID=3162531 RepID=A0ABV3XEK9_9ACTN
MAMVTFDEATRTHPAATTPAVGRSSRGGPIAPPVIAPVGCPRTAP